MAGIATTNWDTAEQAEEAFYRAFQNGDLDAMMEVWSEDDDIVCIHPQGPRLVGVQQVRESWAQILQGSPPLRLQLSDQRGVDGDGIAIRYVNENIFLPGDEQARFTVLATNVYRRTNEGWRIILHHASPTPESLRDLQRAQGDNRAPTYH